MGGLNIDALEKCKACAFRSNKFCSSLSSETRALLASQCRRQIYPGGFKAPLNYWSRDLVLFLDGVYVLSFFSEADGTDHPLFDIMEPGLLTSVGKLIPSEGKQLSVQCIRDCTFALFETAEMQYELMDRPDFTKALWLSTNASLQLSLDGYTCRRVKEVICLVLARAKKYGIEDLSHSEISRITGYDRSLVTKNMKDIVVEHPELFKAGGI